jgi:hypothetical protein
MLPFHAISPILLVGEENVRFRKFSFFSFISFLLSYWCFMVIPISSAVSCVVATGGVLLPAIRHGPGL